MAEEAICKSQIGEREARRFIELSRDFFWPAFLKLSKTQRAMLPREGDRGLGGTLGNSFICCGVLRLTFHKHITDGNIWGKFPMI